MELLKGKLISIESLLDKDKPIKSKHIIDKFDMVDYRDYFKFNAYGNLYHMIDPTIWENKIINYLCNEYKKSRNKFPIQLKDEDFNTDLVAIKKPEEFKFFIAEECGYIKIDKYKSIMFSKGDYIIKNNKGKIEVMDKDEFRINYEIKDLL